MRDRRWVQSRPSGVTVNGTLSGSEVAVSVIDDVGLHSCCDVPSSATACVSIAPIVRYRHIYAMQIAASPQFSRRCTSVVPTQHLVLGLYLKAKTRNNGIYEQHAQGELPRRICPLN